MLKYLVTLIAAAFLMAVPASAQGFHFNVGPGGVHVGPNWNHDWNDGGWNRRGGRWDHGWRHRWGGGHHNPCWHWNGWQWTWRC